MVSSEYVMRQLISALYTIAENAEEFVGTQPLSGDLYITMPRCIAVAGKKWMRAKRSRSKRSSGRRFERTSFLWIFGGV